MKKIIIVFAALCLIACDGNNPSSPKTKGEYVDLGLKSNTKWKNQNEFNPNDPQNGFYSFNEVVDLLKDSLLKNPLFMDTIPTQKQWTELVDECTWSWMGNGYKIVGPNGNSIMLPANGYRDRDGVVEGLGSYGFYWSEANGSSYAWTLNFISNEINLNYYYRDYGFSLRFVSRNKK